MNIKETDNKLIERINKILLQVTNKQALEKVIESGHNGPYHDSETLVRNYSHWIITLTYLYYLSGELDYKSRVHALAEFLYSQDARPNGFSFHHRNGHKDKCNGLIGQAWTFEALVKASEILGDSKYAQLAEDVFFQHNFNDQYGLWNRLEIDGENLSIDLTFNHQLWFASCASLLKTPKEAQIKTMVTRFLDCLIENVTVLNNGLIYHPIERKIHDKYNRYSLKGWVKKIAVRVIKILLFKNDIQKAETNKIMIDKSIGYHQFNMYALAMLKEQMPEHLIWKSDIIINAVDYMLTDDFIQGIEDNKYGFPYNPPGFEVPFALNVLGDLGEQELKQYTEFWMNKQFDKCYNPITSSMDRNTEDPITHNARFYEVTRLLDMKDVQKISLDC
mgnify:CR=1 FL=1